MDKKNTFILIVSLMTASCIAAGVISYGGKEFRFAPLGTVPQSLVIAGGVENLVAERLNVG